MTAVYVDLDGTLVHTDLLVESALRFVVSRPLQSYRLLIWVAKGKAHLKAQLASRIELDPSSLPYNAPLLEHLADLAANGSPLYLATAANKVYAEAVARHLGVFSGVLASDEHTNLSGARKRDAIERAAGGKFIYVGNSADDLPIWSRSSGALAVEASPSVLRALGAQRVPVLARFDRNVNRLGALLRALRPHQWLKNLLVLLPVLPIVGAMPLGPMLINTAWAFLAFCACASAIYLVNDMADLAADRAHPRKRKRPFAAGEISPLLGLAAVLALLVLAGLLAVGLGGAFVLALGVYLALTLAYTFGLKQYPIVDVLILAMLYTLRVLAGAAAIRVVPSFWILAFSMFMFFSLALAKRFVELDAVSATTPGVGARGYRPRDMPSIFSMGIVSGYMAVLVVALYINSPDITGRYGQVSMLWGLCPLLMLWVSRIWLKAARSEVHDDPLVFALTDRASLLIIGAAIGVVLLAIAGGTLLTWPAAMKTQ